MYTFDPRDMLLSLKIGFSFVRAAVACAILERISGFEPSSETTAPRYLKLVTVPSFCSDRKTEAFKGRFISGNLSALSKLLSEEP